MLTGYEINVIKMHMLKVKFNHIEWPLLFTSKVAKSRTKKQKNKTLYQRAIYQKPMTSELPQGRNANAVVVRVAAEDVEASRGKAPNNCLIASNFLFTARIGQWLIIK